MPQNWDMLERRVFGACTLAVLCFMGYALAFGNWSTEHFLQEPPRPPQVIVQYDADAVYRIYHSMLEDDAYRIVELSGTLKDPDGKIKGFSFYMEEGRWTATREGDR